MTDKGGTLHQVTTAAASTGKGQPAGHAGRTPARREGRFGRYGWLYLFLLPSIVSVLIFSYLPMFGIVIAFQDFDILKGYFKSPLVGLSKFKLFLEDPEFYRVFFYTVRISLTGFIVGFPMPIALALLLNQIRNQPFKRVVQSISYLPHFLSWVIAATMVYSMLASDGVLNKVIAALGGERLNFLGDPRYFVPIVVISGIWKEVGWATIVYLAAIAGINPELYESAVIDGAGNWKQTWHITLPCMVPIMVIIGLYSMGGLLSVNFDQVFNLQNSLIRYDTNVISTYVYYKGVQQGEYSLAAAFGLFNSIISLALLAGANKISRRVSEIALW